MKCLKHSRTVFHVVGESVQKNLVMAVTFISVILMASLLPGILKRKSQPLEVNKMEYNLDLIAKAIATEESASGTNITPRHEKGYFEKIKVWNKKDPNKIQFWQNLYDKYGEDMEKSYGIYQVMYPTAVDYGFTGAPQELANPETNRKYFNVIFADLLKKNNNNIINAISAYNAGMGGIGTNPGYIKRVMKYLKTNLEEIPEETSRSK